MFKLIKNRSSKEAGRFIVFAKEFLGIKLSRKQVYEAFLKLDSDFFEGLEDQHQYLIQKQSPDRMKHGIEDLLAVAEELLDQSKIDPEKKADFLIKYVSTHFSTSLYPFLNADGLIDDIGKVNESDMRLNTIVHGKTGRIANSALFKINAPQFRMGNGGVWFVHEDEAEDLVEKLKIDGKAHHYSHRLALLDFRKLSESDGFADRSGIKVALEQDLSNYSMAEDLILSSSFIDGDSIFTHKAFHLYRSILYILSDKNVAATPANIISYFNIETIIDLAFDYYLEDKRLSSLRGMLLSLPGFTSCFEGLERPSLLKQDFQVREELSWILMCGLKFFSVFENLICSHAKDSITFQDIVKNNMVVIAVLPRDNPDASKLALLLFRNSITPLLGVSLESLVKDTIEMRPHKINGFLPCVFGHSIVNELLGMTSICSQIRSLGFGAFRFDQHFSDSTFSAAECNAAIVNSINHLFLPSNDTASFALHLLKSKNIYEQKQGVGATFGCYIPKGKNEVKPFLKTKYNDIAFFLSDKFALQIKL